MHSPWRQRMITSASALLVLAGLAYGFWPRPVMVETALIKRAPLIISVTDEGKTRVIDRFVLSAPVAGMAQRLTLQVGDPVKKNEHLLAIEPLSPAVLDPRERAQAMARVAADEARLGSAKSHAEAARTAATLARRDADRISRLCAGECASRQEQDRAEAHAQAALANQHSAEFAVQIARYELQAAQRVLARNPSSPGDKTPERIPVLSPVNGRILKIMHKSQGAVSTGTPLLEIGNPHALEIATDVLSEDAVRIHAGTPVEYEQWGGSQPLRGVVTAVEPVAFTKVSSLGVEEQRVRVISDITTDPGLWARLGDGYRVDTRFILWKGDNILQAPMSALFREKGRWAVFILKAGRAITRPVELGHRNGLQAQVIKGLEKGDRVITYPDDNLRDGARVTFR